MSPEKTKLLNDRFGHILRADKSPQYALNSYGFQCDDGWFQLMWDLLEKIETHLKTCEISFVDQWHAQQIKEKFGTLRFYAYSCDDTIRALINEAELKSSITCETCGKVGKVRGGRWIQCLCDGHYLKKLVEDVMSCCVHGEIEEFDRISPYTGRSLGKDKRYKDAEISERLTIMLANHMGLEIEDVPGKSKTQS